MLALALAVATLACAWPCAAVEPTWGMLFGDVGLASANVTINAVGGSTAAYCGVGQTCSYVGGSFTGILTHAADPLAPGARQARSG